MPDRQYDITTGMKQTMNTSLRVHVEQTEPERKPNFFGAELCYGDMSSENAGPLQAVWQQFQDAVKRETGQQPGRVVGSYDDLMCVQVLTAQFVGTLCEMGFAYAQEKGIDLPKADKLRGTGGRR